MTRFIRAAGLCSLILLAACTHLPAAGLKIENVEVYPTFECLGIIVKCSGEADSAAGVAVDYRMRKETLWRPAQPLNRIKGGRFAGSVFFLQPGTGYELRLKATGSGEGDGPERIVRAATRSDRFPTGGNREYYVGPQGDDSWPGTIEQPFRNIQKGADLARPGDVVWVLPGVYRESVLLRNSGRSDAHISLRARGKGVILSGADQKYENIEAADRWKDEGGGVYSTLPGYSTRYVAADGQRLYHYVTREEFDEFICGAPGGWHQDKTSGKLFVRLSKPQDPNKLMIQLANLDTGIHVRNADYVLLEGLEVRDYGQAKAGVGVHLDSAAFCVVRHCSLHGMNSEVLISGGRSEGNLIEQCEIWDTSLPNWPWEKTIRNDEGGAGVSSTDGGRGTVIRGCRLHGLFDGVSASYWDSLWAEPYNCDWDVYDNEISDLRDDVIESEGPSVNFRFWNNFCHNLFTGVSLAPINVGPMYVLYNVFYDENWQSLKYGSFDPGMGQGPCLLYHNTIYSRQPAVNTVVVSRPLAGQVFRNNIFYATAYAFWTSKPPLPTNDIDYNDWYTSDTAWHTIWTGAPHKRFFHIKDKDLYSIEELRAYNGWEMHGMFDDPGFVAPDSGDLRLAPGSPCIDRGTVLPNINDGYVGEAPDMGAFESGAGHRSRFPLGSGLGR